MFNHIVNLAFKLDFNLKALGYGVLAFIGCYLANLLLVPLLASGADAMASEGARFVYWFLRQSLGLAALFVPGFLAGRIATRRGFSHGAIAGVIGTLLSALAATLVALFRSKGIPVSGTILFWLFTNAVVAGIGGMVGEYPEGLKLK
jgi:hypothetical protein